MQGEITAPVAIRDGHSTDANVVFGKCGSWQYIHSNWILSDIAELAIYKAFKRRDRLYKQTEY